MYVEKKEEGYLLILGISGEIYCWAFLKVEGCTLNNNVSVEFYISKRSRTISIGCRVCLVRHFVLSVSRYCLVIREMVDGICVKHDAMVGVRIGGAGWLCRN